MKERFINTIFVVALIVVVGIILYNSIQETVIEPIKEINNELNRQRDEVLNSINGMKGTDPKG